MATTSRYPSSKREGLNACSRWEWIVVNEGRKKGRKEGRTGVHPMKARVTSTRASSSLS